MSGRPEMLVSDPGQGAGDARALKFRLLERGLSLTPAAAERLDRENDHRDLTPADYASTSGLILRLEDDVWVNAPIREHNPNFVDTTPPFVLDTGPDGFFVAGEGLQSAASFWVPPEYHGASAPGGQPWNNYVFTHGDRVRLAPVVGCAMACKFCNIPYEDPYATKPIGLMVDALRTALDDPRQPAQHVLISGGTPRPEHVGYLRDVYRTVLTTFTDVPVDIMMVPVDGLIDVRELRDLGVHELSINIEVHDRERARTLMPQKHRYGLDNYLRFIADAAAALGPSKVRSMLMVGLEPLEETIAGVQAVLDAGGVPVLSPFRPDPATPLRHQRMLSAAETKETHSEAEARARRAGVSLGPDCPPCTHNTLTFVPEPGAGGDAYLHRVPSLIE